MKFAVMIKTKTGKDDWRKCKIGRRVHTFETAGSAERHALTQRDSHGVQTKVVVHSK